MTTLVEEETKKVEFVSESHVSLKGTHASDLDIAIAAWVSNNSKDLPDYIKSSSEWSLLNGWAGDANYKADWERIEGLINYLYRERHMSPFEHGYLKFKIDCPIGVSREFMRHRTFSYNETSSRYKEMEPRFFLIDSERPIVQTGKVGAYKHSVGTDEQYGTVFAETTIAYYSAWNSYQNMLAAGVAREVARNVLPLGTMTQFYVSGNPRNWMQFLTLRNDPAALKEIRDIAVKIEEHFAKALPLTYAAYKKYDWRAERLELAELRAKVAQMEAFETYADNIGA